MSKHEELLGLNDKDRKYYTNTIKEYPKQELETMKKKELIEIVIYCIR